MINSFNECRPPPRHTSTPAHIPRHLLITSLCPPQRAAQFIVVCRSHSPRSHANKQSQPCIRLPVGWLNSHYSVDAHSRRTDLGPPPLLCAAHDPGLVGLFLCSACFAAHFTLGALSIKPPGRCNPEPSSFPLQTSGDFWGSGILPWPAFSRPSPRVHPPPSDRIRCANWGASVPAAAGRLIGALHIPGGQVPARLDSNRASNNSTLEPRALFRNF